MLVITFSTVDLFIFYLGFEGISIPIFFLIFLYGAELTKIRAALYFLIYSLSSSTFMALAIFLLYTQFGTTDICLLKTQILQGLHTLTSLPTSNETYSVLSNYYISSLSFERVGLL